TALLVQRGVLVLGTVYHDANIRPHDAHPRVIGNTGKHVQQFAFRHVAKPLTMVSGDLVLRQSATTALPSLRAPFRRIPATPPHVRATNRARDGGKTPQTARCSPGPPFRGNNRPSLTFFLVSRNFARAAVPAATSRARSSGSNCRRPRSRVDFTIPATCSDRSTPNTNVISPRQPPS